MNISNDLARTVLRIIGEMKMDELKQENLLCTKRQRMSKAEILKPEQKSAGKDTNIARNEFEADYDRQAMKDTKSRSDVAQIRDESYFKK